MKIDLALKPIQLAFWVLVCLLSQTVHADFSTGMQAYNAHDYVNAMTLLKPEAENGNRIAQNIVGVMCMNGLGVQQDDSEAMSWYRRSADQGYAVAQTNVGFLYQYGRGVVSDPGEAKHWYELAVAQGDQRAASFLQVLSATALQRVQIPSIDTIGRPTPNIAASENKSTFEQPRSSEPKEAPKVDLQSSEVATKIASLSDKSIPELNGNPAAGKKPYLAISILLVMATWGVLFFRTMTGEANKALPRPQCVSTAVLLIWVSMGIGLVRLLVIYSVLNRALPPVANLLVATVLIFVFAIIFFLNVLLSAGKNWARILFLILFILGLIPTVPMLLAEVVNKPLTGLVSLVQLALQGYATYSLFIHQSSEWFRSSTDA